MKKNEEEILDIFKDKSISISAKIRVIKELEKAPDSDVDNLRYRLIEAGASKSEIDQCGFYGNVWIRKQYYPVKATVHDGHTHTHDHMSIVVSGKVLVEVEGYEPKEFTAPTFFTVAAEKHHKITALEDETAVFCVFALRDADGKSADEYYSEGNTPYAEGEILPEVG